MEWEYRNIYIIYMYMLLVKFSLITSCHINQWNRIQESPLKQLAIKYLQ